MQSICKNVQELGLRNHELDEICTIVDVINILAVLPIHHVIDGMQHSLLQYVCMLAVLTY